MTILSEVGSCITRAQQHSLGWQGNSSEIESIPFQFKVQITFPGKA